MRERVRGNKRLERRRDEQMWERIRGSEGKRRGSEGKRGRSEEKRRGSKGGKEGRK